MLGPRGKKGISLYLSPLRALSQFTTTLWVSCSKPSCFSKLDVLGSHPSDQVPRVGALAVEYKPLTLPKALTVYIFESVLFTKLQKISMVTSASCYKGSLNLLYLKENMEIWDYG